MAHTAQSPFGKILEAMWWWIDNNAALNSFLSGVEPGREVQKFKLYDGSIMKDANISATETPALMSETGGGQSLPLTGVSYETAGSIFSENLPAGILNVQFWGYMDTLNFDRINNFYSKFIRALAPGLKTNFAVPSESLLTGTNQIIQSVDFGQCHPGGIWINPSSIERSRNEPPLSFFMVEMFIHLCSIAEQP